MGNSLVTLPPQQLPLSKKNNAWRKRHLDWADSKSFFNFSLVRKSVVHKKINYDLLNGKLHMSDLKLILNPSSLQASFIPDRIQHYAIINSKLNVLKGEEYSRLFDYKIIVTNPNAISEIEKERKELLQQLVEQEIKNEQQSEEDFSKKLEELNYFFTYEYQDEREIRANALVEHYSKEYNFKLLFNQGFMDALIIGEEMYKCDIVSGEPTIERLNPLKVRIFKSGYSNKIEDADMIIIEDYWSPGKVIDTYYKELSKKDMEYIEKMPDHMGQAVTDSMGNVDERYGFVNNYMVGEEISTNDSVYFDPFGANEGVNNSLLPYDMAGNLRVLQVFWKSRRKIKEVKSFNPKTGEEEYTFYDESYEINTDLGEEERIYYINEAWEGTKIGSDIYVNMRPRQIQYNRLSNPSKCHFGIIGSIYNLNDSRPFSLVDMMKPYNYLYDAVHDRLNKLIAKNWGKIIRLDFAKVPKGWDIDKWMYYAKTMGIAVENSFNEGDYGAATGKLAGGLNNASTGVIDAEFGNSIQSQIQLLEYIKNEMSDVTGISRQREGQISNRETVGGVERSTLQSSHITEWIFSIHDDVKKRVIEAFLETAKIAMKGRNKKFKYILPDFSTKMIEIDGDEFAECDYGLVADNGETSQKLNQQLNTLAQAALQNQLITFSSLMKLYSSTSLAEKQRMIEKEERNKLEAQQQQQQQQLEMQQQALQQQKQLEELKMKQQDVLNQRDNETKIMVAEINSKAEAERFAMMNDDTLNEKDILDIEEKKRQFNEKLKLDREKLDFDRKKSQEDILLKREALKSKQNNK